MRKLEKRLNNRNRGYEPRKIKKINQDEQQL